MKLLESYPPTITTHDATILILFWVCFFIVYFLRKFPIFDVLWKLISWFFIMLLVVLGANFLKKEVKNWWDDK